MNTLPQTLKDWFGSEDVFSRADQIYAHFHLDRLATDSVAAAIRRVLFKELEPRYFAGQLSLALKLEKNQALLLAGEIARLLFLPAAQDLGNAGIDVHALETFEIPSPQMLQATPKSSTAPAATETVSPAPQDTTAAKPVMVFTKEEFAPIAPRPSVIDSSANKIFERTAPTPPRAPVARVELGMPSEKLRVAPRATAMNAGAAMPRVVHYISPTTPLAAEPSGEPAPVPIVNLPSAAVSANKPKSESAPTHEAVTPSEKGAARAQSLYAGLSRFPVFEKHAPSPSDGFPTAKKTVPSIPPVPPPSAPKIPPPPAPKL